MVATAIAAVGVASPAGAEPGAAGGGPPADGSFQKVTLNDFPGEPMSLAVLPDRRVLHTTRTGEVFIHEPATGLNRLAANIPVYEHDEEGLQGIAIDPDFGRNRWVYLYYSPPLNTPVDDPSTPDVNEGDAPQTGTEADWARFRGVMRLSRFQLRGHTLDLGSEQRIIDVPTDRGICCHVGGQIDFDSRGNLYLSTGDDTNPFASNGFAPIDERPAGLTRLPPVAEAEVAYSYGVSAEFPELGTGGIGPMGGPAYRYDRRNPSRTKWPEYYDGVPLFFEWTRDYVKEFRLDRRGPTQNTVREVRPVLTSLVFDNPMDLEFGPDGALYVLEYGDGFFAENPDAQLSRFDFVRGNRIPIPQISATPMAGLAPLTVQFSSAGTVDPDGDALRYAWDFDANGTVDSTEPNPTHTLTANGAYRPTVNVTDSTGRSAAATLPFLVGPAPVVSFVTPVEGQPFEFGQTVAFQVSVVDDEPEASGCSGSITTVLDPGHGDADDLTAVFVAEYTDAPSDPGTPPQTGTATVVLEPDRA